RPARLVAEATAPGGARVARAYAVGEDGAEEVRLFVARSGEPPDPDADEPAFAARGAGAPTLRWAGASALHVRLRAEAAVRRRLERHGGVYLSYSALPPPLAIEDVTVIDATGAPPRPHATVLVEDGRVVAVGPASELRAPPGARRVAGAGAFLVPGLWDMHAHLSLTAEPSLPLYVANGVTGVRDMGGDLDEIDAWQLRIASGALVGPRVARPGPLVDGPKPGAAFRETASTPDEARRAVRGLAERGVDFVKVHNRVPREAFFALADEAKRLGLRVAGHLPRGVSAEEAVAAGQHSVEHTESLVEAALFEPGSPARSPEEGLAAYTPQRAAALWASYRAAGTWVCPTLVEYRAFAHDGEPALLDDPRGAWLSGPARAHVERWSPPPPPPPPGQDPNAGRKAMFAQLERLVGEMSRAGVGLLAGTDPPGRGVFPGFSLHDELALLVEAGLTPMQALQAATFNPALFLGLDATAGTVEPGKDADLVVLDADPLAS
ncbi:MAG TPA: amidohydrolase family protein, partial [Polyangiaceae bacterium]|nr:amidohydrolase family protein [Polyangiaceae bacterium]